jgi:O-antigen ligase/tetratricopeptide (TPR) repeat protein
MSTEENLAQLDSPESHRGSPARASSADLQRRHSRRFRYRSHLLWLTACVLGLVIVGAPLAVGAVHRPVILAVMGLSVGLAALATALTYHNQAALKPHVAFAMPMLFLLIGVVQITPIPRDLRSHLDPTGSELLGLAQLHGAQPLSLDPPETRAQLAKAAASLAVGLAAFLLSSRRRFRSVSVGLVASAGLAALVVGLAHRAVAEGKIYGLFASNRGLLTGPFINPNHLAELLELAAFAALAFAFSRSSLYGQRLWKLLAAALAAGALSTLSRGSLLALGAGALTWFLLAPRSDEGEALHRTRFGAMLVASILVAGIALGFGADALVERFSQTRTGGDVRFSVWRDCIRIVSAHPLGVGLGAFGRTYPIYQTSPSTLWFQFPENQPLQILVEAGIPGAVLLVAAFAFVIRDFIRRSRRDRVEASLAAGLVAVLAHNLTDFGLETFGVLLPLSAIWGAVFGRQAEVLERPVSQSLLKAVAGATAIAAAAGGALLLLPTARDFDQILNSRTGDVRAVARAASEAHPTDYAYALAEARLQPLFGLQQPARLRMLNRAMTLCPTCWAAHAEAARTLWELGLRQQALIEWRTVLGLSPMQLDRVFGELLGSGATPADLVSLAGDRNRYAISRLLLAGGMLDAAEGVLANAGRNVDSLLAQADIAIARHDLHAARAASDAALSLAPRDPRAVLVAADVAARLDDREKAIEITRAGLLAEPTNVDLNRRMLALLSQTDRWLAIDQALGSLRVSLSMAGAPMAEANLAAASIFERRGQFRRAVSEYQAALAHDPENVGVLLALARAAEQCGRVATAVDAYSAILRKGKDNVEARSALERIERDKKLLEVYGSRPPPTGKDNR